LDKRKRKRRQPLRWKKESGQYISPDIENCIQLLQVIRTGVATYGQIALHIHPESTNTPYWTLVTPDLAQTVRPWHVRLVVKRNLIDLYDMSSEEFLAQDALGTLVGKVIIGYVDENQLEFGL